MNRNDIEFLFHAKDHRTTCDGCGEPIGKELAARMRQGLTYHERCLIAHDVEVTDEPAD